MNEQRLVITTDQKPSFVALCRQLPAICSGRAPDHQGIGEGFRSRLGFAILSLVAPNFDQLGRGEPGADGTIWPPLSREYLAYGRRFGPGEVTELIKGAGLNPKVNKFAPGKTKAGNDKKGLLSAEQLKLWRKTYADRLAWYIMREPDDAAKRHAAAVAWIVVKQAGGKTKLDVFGNRKVQMLVDTGRLRGSLQPGTLVDKGISAEYYAPAGKGGNEQEFDTKTPYQVIIGTNVEYAKHHHFGTGVKHRPLWPENFPSDWWRQIIGICISGLQNIKELYRNP